MSRQRRNSALVKTTHSKRSARTLVAAAAVAGAGVLAVAGALAAPAGAQTAQAAGAAAARPLHVTRIAYGEQLHHKFLPNGPGSTRPSA